MNIHPFRLISLWLLTILITVQVTLIVEGDKVDEVIEVVEVEYIVLTEQEYEEEYNIQEVIEMESIGEFNVSAYCPCEICCGPYADGITSSGERAIEGITIAADPNVLPEGTEVYIEGIGHRIVQDTGGAIKGNKLDLFFSSHQDALNFGRQYLEVFKEVD
jgi:3D (Asp-Asp-Asp) domain-containing protein